MAAADQIRQGAESSPTTERRKLRGRNFPVLAFIFLVSVVLVGVAGPLILPLDAFSGTLMTALKRPVWMEGGSWSYPLGTDQLGRDILSRLIVGARITVIIAIAGVFVSAIVGTSIGLLAGYLGGLIDTILMRITDAMLAIPMLVLGLALAAATGAGVVNVIFVTTAVTWAFFARLVRGEVLHIRELDYIKAAEIAGFPQRRILLRHILPNVFTPLLVMASLQIGNTIILASSLSFLGLGVPEPLPEWGLMLANSRDYITFAPHLVVMPAIALGLMVLSCNVIGDWLRDRFDPELDHLR
ncbi:ABC transporter permease [Chelativorans sp. Marseille-P2723]|uniref:ABC transporter permease n=1 Tax=Chelativorans sp. Marseille-P2723 TaxID=2709133 RepID=UPI00156E207C|nr:ABC transporter permease [Chelativorans sp. Marseille-P2723]